MNKNEFAVKLMKGHVAGKVYLTEEGKKTLEKWAAFNLNDPFEVQLFNHANKYSVFSAYIKRLIQREMEEQKGNVQSKRNVVRSEGGGYKIDFS